MPGTDRPLNTRAARRAALGALTLGVGLAGACARRAASDSADSSGAQTTGQALRTDTAAADPAALRQAESAGRYAVQPPRPGEMPVVGRGDSSRRMPDVTPNARPEPMPGSAAPDAAPGARPGAAPSPRRVPTRPSDATPSIPNKPDVVPLPAEPGAPAQDPAVARLEREARALATTSGCAAAGQCRVAPFGARACGGPREYIAYCPLTTDSARLFRRLAELERAERAYLAKAGIASICSVVVAPAPGYANGRCTAGAASGLRSAP